MLNQNIPLSSFDLAQREIQKSPIYERMSKEQISYFINESLRIGKEEAQKYLLIHKNIYQLLDEHKICYEVKKTKKQYENFVLRGDINFKKESCNITIYDESIHSIYLDHRHRLPKSLELSEKQALELHLAHEFFHFLEFKSGVTVSERLGKIKLPVLLNFARKVDVIECSEIAAHSFAKQFCRLKVLPNYYDLHYLYHQNK